jgi:hypothetical protein
MAMIQPPRYLSNLSDITVNTAPVVDVKVDATVKIKPCDPPPKPRSVWERLGGEDVFGSKP